MELKFAEAIAITFVSKLNNIKLLKRAELCGSIRRKKSEVHDADIVVVPTPNTDLVKHLKNFYKCNRAGSKLVNLTYKELDIDVYITTDENYEVIKLIRTGSAEHNKKLCGLAIQKGWKLWADGSGLRTGDGDLISNTEHGILEKLLGKYVEPESRD